MVFTKTIVYIYTDKYPFSFGEFVKGLLYIINYAMKNGIVVKLNIEITGLSNYINVENYKVPPGYQTKVYYNNNDDASLLLDELQAFKKSPSPIYLLTTNLEINRNEIDSITMIEFNKLIRFNPVIDGMVNNRLQGGLLNSLAPPLITDEYIVLNMFLSNISLDRAQLQQLAEQMRSSVDLTKTYIIVSNSSYIRTTLTAVLGSYNVFPTQTIDTLDALESSIVDFVIVSRSKKIYTFSEYNANLKKISYNLGESSSLTSVSILSQIAYITSTLAGVYPEAEFTDGDSHTASFSYPSGLGTDSDGNLYVADTMNNNIRKIHIFGNVDTIAGSLNQGSGSLNGVRSSALFYGPTGLTVDPNLNIYVVDAINGLIRKIDPDGNVTTLAGNGGNGFSDGTGNNAIFNFLY